MKKLFLSLILLNLSFATQASSCLDVLNHILERSKILKLEDREQANFKSAVEQFYDPNNERFFDEVLGIRFTGPKVYEQKIAEVLRVPYEQGSVLLFHNLNKRFSFSYAAVVGVGVIRVIKVNRVKDLIPAYKLLTKEGLSLPAFFGSSTFKGVFHGMFEYIPGPNLLELKKLSHDEVIDKQVYTEAAQSFQEFQKDFTNTLFRLVQKGELKGELAARFIPNEHNSIYYQGRWYLYHPSLK